MAFKMKGFNAGSGTSSGSGSGSAFKKEPEKKPTAEFMSYDEMINSDRYKKAIKTKKPNTFTYWDTVSEFEGGPEKKVVQTENTGIQDL